MSVLKWFVGLGPAVMLPILIFIFGLILGLKSNKSFKAGITVGIGFIGLNLVIGLLTDSLGPAAQAMVDKFGLSLNYIDVGWPAASAIAYGTVLGSLTIPIGIVVNVLLLLLGLTKTLNVDIWNYWHCALTGSLVYAATNNFALGIYTIVVHVMLIYLLADINAKTVQEFYGLPNISFPHGLSAVGFLVAKPMNYVFDRIPGLNKLEANPETIQKRLGVFGDSTVMGIIIGLVIGILAGYDASETLNLGIKTGAVMTLMPRMVALLMEGLTPVSEAATKFVQKQFPGRELFIGMDSALSVGHPAVLATSLILVPLTLFIAVVLPGNKVLPFGDLATIPFIICLMVAVFKGNIVRSVLGGIIYIIMHLYIATYMGPTITKVAKSANFDLAGNSVISVLSDGGLLTTLGFVTLGEKLAWLGITIIAIVVVVSLYYVNKVKNKPTVD